MNAAELLPPALPARVPPAPEVLDLAVAILASRPASLRRCLASIAAASRPRPAEILVVINGRREECAGVAAGFASLPGLEAVDVGTLSPGGGRNLAASRARSAWVCFLDDDARVPPGYFARLGRTLALRPRAAVIGGPDRTPPESSLAQRCAGHLLGSWPAAGPLRRRHAGFASETWTDDRGLILCNLSFRRSCLGAVPFDESLARNEENLLVARLLAAGHGALHDPGLWVFHERRPGLAGFARQCFLSGLGRAAMSFKLPGSLRAFHLLPLLPALCLAGAAATPRLAWPAAAYALLAAANALHLARRHGEGLAACALLAVLMPAAHLSYAAGLLAGFAAGVRASLPRRRRNPCA